jgi:hypothetical protein
LLANDHSPPGRLGLVTDLLSPFEELLRQARLVSVARVFVLLPQPLKRVVGEMAGEREVGTRGAAAFSFPALVLKVCVRA